MKNEFALRGLQETQRKRGIRPLEVAHPATYTPNNQVTRAKSTICLFVIRNWPGLDLPRQALKTSIGGGERTDPAYAAKLISHHTFDEIKTYSEEWGAH